MQEGRVEGEGVHDEDGDVGACVAVVEEGIAFECAGYLVVGSENGLAWVWNRERGGRPSEHFTEGAKWDALDTSACSQHFFETSHVRQNTLLVGINQLGPMLEQSKINKKCSYLVVSKRHNSRDCFIVHSFTVSCEMLIDQFDQLHSCRNGIHRLFNIDPSRNGLKVRRGEYTNVCDDRRLNHKRHPLVVEAGDRTLAINGRHVRG